MDTKLNRLTTNLENLAARARGGEYTFEQLQNHVIRVWKGVTIDPPTPAPLPDRAEAATTQELASSSTPTLSRSRRAKPAGDA